MPEALKGCPMTRREEHIPKCRWPLQGSARWGAFPRVNPGLSSRGPLGRRPDPTQPQALGKWPNSTQALRASTLTLSLRDKKIRLIEEPRIELAPYAVDPWHHAAQKYVMARRCLYRVRSDGFVFAANRFSKSSKPGFRFHFPAKPPTDPL
jgi:hypothetical protein